MVSRLPEKGNSVPHIGIFGGTFDPIHIGHLAAIDDVRDQLGLERVLFIPNQTPPHKRDRHVSEARDRMAMVRLAVASNDAFRLDPIEHEREGPSYSLDTLRALRQRYGEDVKIDFIVGFDALKDLHEWHEPDAILAEFGLTVMDRPPEDGEEADRYPDRWREIEQRFPEIHAQIQRLHVPQLAISGADIRRRVREGRSIRYLVQPAVEDYIRERGLYR